MQTRYWALSRIARRSRRRNARWHSCSSPCPTNQCATRIDVPAGRTRNKTWTFSVCAFAIGRRRYPECCWHARLTRALPGILVLPFGHVAGPHGRRLLCHRTRKAFLNSGTSCLTPRMMALKAPCLSRCAAATGSHPMQSDPCGAGCGGFLKCYQIFFRNYHLFSSTLFQLRGSKAT